MAEFFHEFMRLAGPEEPKTRSNYESPMVTQDASGTLMSAPSPPAGVYYTAQLGGSVELMRVTLEGTVTRLTHSKPGVRHYHPAASPCGNWLLFGSDRSGSMQLYVAR